MFKFVTWCLVSVAFFAGVGYYNSVERPDHNLPAALAQFDNDDDTAKELRRRTFVENEVNMLLFTGWVGFTALCFYGDIKKGVSQAIKGL